MAMGAAALLGCSSAEGPPGTFGVNLTIDMDASVKSQITSVALHVTGAETYDKTLDLGAFSGGEARVHYVPGVMSGALTFTADGLGTGQAIIATGTSGSVTLTAGKAVSASLTLRSSSPMGTGGRGGTGGSGGGGTGGNGGSIGGAGGAGGGTGGTGGIGGSVGGAGGAGGVAGSGGTGGIAGTGGLGGRGGTGGTAGTGGIGGSVGTGGAGGRGGSGGTGGAPPSVWDTALWDQAVWQ